MTEIAKPEQTAMNRSGSDAGIDALLTQLGSLPVPETRNPVVYFLQKDDLVKIGFSQLLPIRIMTLEGKNKGSLRLLGTVPGAYETEQKYHARFAHLRVHGEWFKASDELLTAISDESVATPKLLKPTYKEIAVAFTKRCRANLRCGNSRLICAQTNVGFWLNMLANGETPERVAGLEEAMKFYLPLMF